MKSETLFDLNRDLRNLGIRLKVLEIQLATSKIGIRFDSKTFAVRFNIPGDFNDESLFVHLGICMSLAEISPLCLLFIFLSLVMFVPIPDEHVNMIRTMKIAD